MTKDLDCKLRAWSVAIPMLLLTAGLAGCGGGGGAEPPLPQPPPAVAPGAFTVSVAVDADLDHLIFSWSEASGAERYQVEMNVSETLGFLGLGDALPSTVRMLATGRPTLVDHWQVAAVRVRACNAIGCTSTPDVAFNSLFLDSFAPKDQLHLQVPPSSSAGFGRTMAVSGNAQTMAVAALGDAAVPQTQPAVHIFVRSGVGAPWLLQSTIPAQPPEILGTALALSGDGNTLAIGQPASDGPNDAVADAGLVVVYERIGTTWSQVRELDDLSGSQLDGHFGAALALSNDGAMLVIGVPGKDVNQSFGSGSVHVVTRPAGGWSQPLSSPLVLTVPDGVSEGTASQARFGTAVAISATADRLAIGAPGRADAGVRAGAVYIYNRSPGTSSWQLESGTLRASLPERVTSFGAKLAFAANGRRLAATLFRPVPTVDVFTRDDANVWNASAVIEVPDSAREPDFGAALAMLGDATLAIGAPDSETDLPGAVYVFNLVGDVWKALPGPFTPSVAVSAASGFGTSVLLPDARTLLIGAPAETQGGLASSGSVYVH